MSFANGIRPKRSFQIRSNEVRRRRRRRRRKRRRRRRRRRYSLKPIQAFTSSAEPP